MRHISIYHGAPSLENTNKRQLHSEVHFGQRGHQSEGYAQYVSA